VAKIRLDRLLTQRGLAADEDEARRLIMAGKVLIDDAPADKPGAKVAEDAAARLRGKTRKFASRAGEKLAAALDAFGVDPGGLIALDLGASTGGFTDCLLQRGARKVYAVDVGTNQLDYRLRSDSRVIGLERTHAKDLNRELVPDPIEFFTVDVSFTSLRYVLPPLAPLLAPTATGVCLFKPQFEAPREAVRPGGLVDSEAARNALTAFKAWLLETGADLWGETPSAVKGRTGNQEFMLWLRLKKP